MAEQCPFIYVGETGFIFIVTAYSLDHVEHVIKQIFVVFNTNILLDSQCTLQIRHTLATELPCCPRASVVKIRFLGLGGYRLMAKVWRSVFPDLLTLLCFAFCLVMVVAEMLGTVDLVEKDTDTLVFWTCDEENSGVVFQIGTSDAVQAVQAANLVYVCHSYLFAYL